MVCFNRDYHFVFISSLEMILTANGHFVVCVCMGNHFLSIYFSFPIALREMIPCRICYCLLGLTNQTRMFQTVRPIKCLLSNACVKNLAPSVAEFTHSNQRTTSAWLCMNYEYFNLRPFAKQKTICLFPVAIRFEIGSVGRLSIFIFLFF